jgi:hypothetical protein
LKLFLFISFLSVGIWAHAQTLSNGQREYRSDDPRIASPYTSTEPSAQTNTQGSAGTNSGTYTYSSGNNNVVEGQQGQNLNATGGYAVTQNSGRQAAANTMNQGGGSQMLGLAMGAAFASQCGWQNPFACVAAAMSFMDAAASGSSKLNGIDTLGAIDVNTGLPRAVDGTDPYQEQIAAGLEQLASMGYTVNPDGSVNTPDGMTLTAEDLSSVEALMNKGVSPDAAANAMQSISDTRSEVSANMGMKDEDGAGAGQAVAASGLGSGGEGGGSGGAAGGQAMGDLIIEEIEYRGADKKKKGDGRMPASQAAELSKNFNGTPIGIGMADLFLIVHKKYDEKKKSKKGEFITREF